MPRARIPNVRFGTSADSPSSLPLPLLLPFLAPRFLPASLFQPARTNHCTGLQPEERGYKSYEGSSGLGTNRENSAPVFSSLNTRYADIFAYARQQTRGYTTEPPPRPGKVRRILTKKRPITVVRKVGPLQSIPTLLKVGKHEGRRRVDQLPRLNSIRKVRRVGSKASVNLLPRRDGIEKAGRVGRIRRVQVNLLRRIPSPLKVQKFEVRRAPRLRPVGIRLTPSSRGDSSLMDRRRRRALELETKRLDNLLSYEKGTDPESLMQMGRYRTLQRRIYNYSRRSPTILDMRRFDTEIEGSRLLFQGFAAVVRNLYPGARRSSHFLKIIHHPGCKRFLQRVFIDTEAHDEEQAWRNWMEIEQEQRAKYWDLLLLYLVDRNPDRSLQFLRVIARDSSLDLNAPILADSFEILARRYLKGEMTGMRNKASFVPTFCHIFRQYLADIKPVCTQDLLLSIAKLAHADDLKLVWHLIEDKVFWGYDTLLHWASTFGEQGQHKHALLCLEKVVSFVSNKHGKQDLVDRERFRWSCALVLRKSVVNGENYDMTADIVAQFLKLGVKLDILLYNVVMNNAMEAGDYNVAFRVFNLLEENGVKPDKHTYSILLHGCTLSENPTMFRDFAVHCEKMAKELQDPWLATDCLYYEYICHNNRDETDIERVFPILHRTYSQFFTLEPLSWLPNGYDVTAQRHANQQEHERQLTLDSDNQDHEYILPEPVPLLEPSQVAIYLMLQMEIRRAISISTTAVWELYLLFRNQVRSQHNALILELARNPIIWNAFLLAFCRAQQFANASHLIKSMPTPNVYSWNMFMQSFFKSEQVQAAEKVWEIMRTRNVEPDQFTWTTLIRGYARGQRVEKIAGIMENVDKERQLHPAILAALGRMTDRESLMRELEKARRNKERKEADKLREEENKRLGRWALPRFSPLIKNVDDAKVEVHKPGKKNGEVDFELEVYEKEMLS